MATITISQMRGFLERAGAAGRKVELTEDEKIDRGVLRSFDQNNQSCGLSAGVKFRAHPETVAKICDDSYDDTPAGEPPKVEHDWPPRGSAHYGTEGEGSPSDAGASSGSSTSTGTGDAGSLAHGGPDPRSTMNKPAGDNGEEGSSDA